MLWLPARILPDPTCRRPPLPQAIRRATVNTFGYIAKAIGPQDVLVTLLNNLKVQERQNRVCTTVAIAIVAETCMPFTVGGHRDLTGLGTAMAVCMCGLPEQCGITMTTVLYTIRFKC